MEVYLQSLGFNVWHSIENGYNIPKIASIEVDKRKYECNSWDRNSILCGLVDSDFTKVMKCTSTK